MAILQFIHCLSGVSLTASERLSNLVFTVEGQSLEPEIKAKESVFPNINFQWALSSCRLNFSGMVMYTPTGYTDSGTVRVELSEANKIPPHADSIIASLAALVLWGPREIML